MSLEVTSCCAGVVALCTVEGFFSPEGIFVCLLMQEAVVQEKSHCLQLKGFCPEWVSMCVLRLSHRVQE